MGYDIDRFVNLSPEIAENFKCSICLDIFEAPLELPCGHIFCLECIRSCFGGSSICECPECRRRVELREVKPPNRKLLYLLHGLNIKCEFAVSGCCMVVKVENVIAHTGECQFNTSPWPTAPLADINYGHPETLADLLGDDSNIIERLERLQRLQAILASFTEMMNENDNELNQVSYSYDGESQDDNELLIQDDIPCIGLCALIGIALSAFLLAAPVAAIVISILKFQHCTQIPTLPHALLALGISLFLSVILEGIRNCFFNDKFCVGLKAIQSFALGSLIYLAVVVYSNVGLTCDNLLFDFSFWLVSALLALISICIILSILYAIYENLTTVWSEWESSHVLLSFIYIIPISGLFISVSTITMGSVFFDSCPDVPSLTTRLVVFGSLGFMCWLIMLLNSKFIKNICFWMFLISVVISFICVAVPVHDNFSWDINCNTTIYTYSFVIVCVNYIIIGLAIFMYLIYGGICACLFFK